MSELCSCKDLLGTGHTVKNVSILSENRLDLVYKKVDMGMEPIGKNFVDNLDDGGQKSLTKEALSFFRMRATKA